MRQNKTILEKFKLGITEFVEISVKEHHDKLLARIPKVEQSGFTPCFVCNKKNLYPGHSKKRCPSPTSCLCKCELKGKRPCPYHICNYICEGIIKDHMKYSPNFETTDISQWTRNHWEIAKCYMEHSFESARTTDILDLLHLMANNKFVFQKVVQVTKGLSNEKLQTQLNKVIKICQRINHSETTCTPEDIKDICIFLSYLKDESALRVKEEIEKNAVEHVKTEESNLQYLENVICEYFRSKENDFESTQKRNIVANSDSSSLQVLFEQRLCVGETVNSFVKGDSSQINVADLIDDSIRYCSIFVDSTEINQKTSINWNIKEWLIFNILAVYFKKSCKDGYVIRGSSPSPKNEKHSCVLLVSKEVSDTMKIPFEMFKTCVKDVLKESKGCLVILDCSYKSFGKIFERHTVIQMVEFTKFRKQTHRKRPNSVYVKLNQVKLTVKHEGENNVLQKKTARVIKQMLFNSVKNVGRQNISLSFDSIAFVDVTTKVCLPAVFQITSLQLHECVFTPVTNKLVQYIEITSSDTKITYYLDRTKLILYPLLQNNTNPLSVKTSKIIVGNKTFCITLESTTMDNKARDFFGVPLQNCSKENIDALLYFEMLSGCDIDDYKYAEENDKLLILSSIRYGLLMSNPSYVHVYPAECHLIREHPKDVVFVCFIEEDIDIDKDCVFGIYRGFQTFQRNYNGVSLESFIAESSLHTDYYIAEEKKRYINETVAYHSDLLMEKHSNLEIISVSMGKAKGNTLDVNKGPHIVLYVRLKSFIPMGENRFPTTLRHPQQFEFPVDVRKGYFIALSDHDRIFDYNKTPKKLKNMVMGCSIGLNGNKNSCGTMGPFVQIEYGNENSENKDIGFLTACHVFGKDSAILDAEVVQPSDTDTHGDEDNVCGKIVAFAYTNEVDAALVKITKRHPLHGSFISCDKKQYKDAGLTNEVKYEDGSISDPNDALKKKVVKFGRTTALTSGMCHHYQNVVKIYKQEGLRVVDPITLYIHYMIYKKMFHIGPSNDGVICEKGDSGAGVFLVDENKKLSCIGIAIGKTSYGYCIVTPIKSILEKLSNTSNNRLKNLNVTMKVFGE